MSPSEIHPLDRSATDLSRALHARELTCAAVMEAALDRIAAVNPVYNAIVSLQPAEDLMAAAKAADEELDAGRSRGWLHGMPFAVKDLSQVKGLPCTWGSLIYKDNIASQDDLHVARIRAAGAIFIGKTNTPEMGFGSHTTNRVFGPCRNAFDTSLSAGGSSGGAAVGLSLGLLPVADGSDMMGSLRNPAAFNGVYGFRPSFGRVPNPGAKDLYFSQLATSGPMGRTVGDMAALYRTMAGYDKGDPLALETDDRPDLASIDGRKLKVAWMADLNGHLATEQGVLETCGNALKVLEAMGAEVTEIAPDFDFDDLWFSWTTLRSFSAAFTLLPLDKDPDKRELLGPQAHWELENRARLTVDDLARATDIRSRWYQCLLGLFARFDYLVLPSAQVFPFGVDEKWPQTIAGRSMDTYHRWMEVVIPASISGLPVAALPAGLSEQGLPMGIQLIGAPRSDHATLEAAAAYEAAVLRSGLAGVQGKVPLAAPHT